MRGLFLVVVGLVLLSEMAVVLEQAERNARNGCSFKRKCLEEARFPRN